MIPDTKCCLLYVVYLCVNAYKTIMSRSADTAHTKSHRYYLLSNHRTNYTDIKIAVKSTYSIKQNY